MKKTAEKSIQGKLLRIVKGDITEREVDAIVNAANKYLQHGGGVAGAIVRKGGAVIQDESDKIGFVPTGSAAMTSAGKLKAKYVIHAVGPKMGEGDEDTKLRQAVQKVLQLASEHGLHSISMPAISSGIFGLPKDRCAAILVQESKKFLMDNPQTSLHCIEFCLLDDETLGFFEKEFAKI